MQADTAGNFYERIWQRKAATTSAGPGRAHNALPFIPPGSRVLDVGCGDGDLLQRLPSASIVVGADLSATAIRLAHRKGLAVVRATFEGPRLPFRAERFDRVTCLDVIEHLFDPTPLLGEMRRVLVSNGRLILQTPNVRHYLHVYRLAVHGRGPRTSSDVEGIDGGHLHYFTAKDVRELLSSAGFVDIELHGTEGVRVLPSVRSLGILCVARKAS